MEITTPQTQQVTSGIACDCCGIICKDMEHVKLSGSWGYNSNHDGEIWDCDLCEDCALKIKAYIVSLGGNIRITNYI